MEPIDESPYLRLIQKTGATRHPGGLEATDALLKRCRLKKRSRLLDVGCGAGFTTAHIARKYGCNVTGVDISQDAMEKARSLYQESDFFNRMSFECASAEHLPFSDAYFDVVLCESVLLFICDKEAALEEMMRVVKPGGFLALNELCISEQSGAQKIKDFFLRPEFGGFLSPARRYVEDVTTSNFDIVVETEQAFDILEHIKRGMLNCAKFESLLQFLEFSHRVITDKQTRKDFLQVFKFALEMPRGGLRHINSFLMLAQKNDALVA